MGKNIFVCVATIATLFAILCALQFATAGANDVNGLDATNYYYYGDKENGGGTFQQSNGNVAEPRAKRFVVTGMMATILWSILFTPLATMTVSKNLDIWQVLMRCKDRAKSHWEVEDPLTAIGKMLLCKATETEEKGKELLLNIVATAFHYMTDEARELLEMEYAVFTRKMQALHGAKHPQVEHLDWNVPGSKGKMFLCFLQEYMLIDNSKHQWNKVFDDDLVMADQFWHKCQANIQARHALTSKAKMGRKIKRWWTHARAKFACLASQVRKWFSSLRDSISSWGKKPVGRVETQKDEEVTRTEMTAQCAGNADTAAAKSSLLALVKEAAAAAAATDDGSSGRGATEWPMGYDLHDDDDDAAHEEFEKVVDRLQADFRVTRQQLIAPFAKYIDVSGAGIEVVWAKMERAYPKVFRLVIDKTLEEAQKSLEYFNLDQLTAAQKSHFALVEIRTVIAHLFAAITKDKELKSKLFGSSSAKTDTNWFQNIFDGIGQLVSKNTFAGKFQSFNAIDRDMLVAGNEQHMETFAELFKIQDENDDLYMEIIVDALTVTKQTAGGGDQPGAENDVLNGMANGNHQAEGKREKRGLDPITTLLFGIGMQQGYRHFNLIQLFRDCIVRSVNYKTFRCSPPPMIQEEIKFIQKAKDIAFQELPKEAVIEIGRQIGEYVNENMRKKSANVPIALTELEDHLNLLHIRDGKVAPVPVPVPIYAFKALIPSGRDELLVAMPSERVRAIMQRSKRMPHRGKSWLNLAANIVPEAEIKIPLRTYMAWENDLDAADRLSQEQIKFHQLHRTEIPIAGREIAKQLVKWAKIEGGAGEGEQSMVPNGMAQRIATILRPAKIIEIPLSYLTDNSAVHATDLLHTLLNRLKKLFHANADVKLPVPINFVAERYQAPTLSVTYNLLSEWIAPNENVEIVFEPEFVELLKQKGFSAIPVPIVWITNSALFDEDEQIHVAREQLLIQYDKMVTHSWNVNHDKPLLMAFWRACSRDGITLDHAICPQYQQTNSHASVTDTALPLYRPTSQPEQSLPFTKAHIEAVQYAPIAMKNMKIPLSKNLMLHQPVQLPRNIWVTIEWLERKRADSPRDSNFRVPIIRRFLDEKIFAKSQHNGEEGEKGGEDATTSSTPPPPKTTAEENGHELIVTVEFLERIMRTSQKIPVPSKMLTDAGLELPWKYAQYLDCNAEYKFHDAETKNRCEIYQKVAAPNKKRAKSIGALKLPPGCRKC